MGLKDIMHICVQEIAVIPAERHQSRRKVPGSQYLCLESRTEELWNLENQTENKPVKTVFSNYNQFNEYFKENYLSKPLEIIPEKTNISDYFAWKTSSFARYLFVCVCVLHKKEGHCIFNMKPKCFVVCVINENGQVNTHQIYF